MTQAPIIDAEYYRSLKIILDSANSGPYAGDLIDPFLAAASDYMESMCYQPLRVKAQDEQFLLKSLYASVNPTGQLNVFPRYFPLSAFTELSYKLRPSDDWTVLDEEDYVVNDGGQGVGFQVIVSPTPILRTSFGIVRAVYSAGFASDDMPEDVKYATGLVVAYCASAGYAAVNVQGSAVRQVVPGDMWKRFIDPVLEKYGRQF